MLPTSIPDWLIDSNFFHICNEINARIVGKEEGVHLEKKKNSNDMQIVWLMQPT